MDKRLFKKAVMNCGGKEGDYNWLIEQMEEFNSPNFVEKIWKEYFKLKNRKVKG